MLILLQFKTLLQTEIKLLLIQRKILKIYIIIIIFKVKNIRDIHLLKNLAISNTMIYFKEKKIYTITIIIIIRKVL